MRYTLPLVLAQPPLGVGVYLMPRNYPERNPLLFCEQGIPQHRNRGASAVRRSPWCINLLEMDFLKNEQVILIFYKKSQFFWLFADIVGKHGSW